MKFGKTIKVIAAILSLSAVLSACQTTEVSSTVNEYPLGSIDIPGKDGALCGAPIYIAYEKGFLKEEGFDVNLISADFESRKIGLNNGTIPIVNGDFQFFPSIENDIDVKVVDGLHYGCIKFVVRKGSDIKKAEDLKGKKIGVDEIGGTPHQVASVWIEKVGISALQQDNEVTFVPYSDGNLELEALRKGDIDVAALWDPLASIAAKNTDEFEVIFDLAKDPTFAGKYCCFLFASSKVIKESPEKIAALLRAYRKAQDWISKNPAEAVDIIADKNYSAIEDKELAKELITSYGYPSSEDRSKGSTVKDDVLYFSKELHNIGYLETDPEKFTGDVYHEVDVNKK